MRRARWRRGDHTRQCFSKLWKMAQPHSRYTGLCVVRHSRNSASTVSGRSRLWVGPPIISETPSPKSPLLNIVTSGASPVACQRKRSHHVY